MANWSYYYHPILSSSLLGGTGESESEIRIKDILSLISELVGRGLLIFESLLVGWLKLGLSLSYFCPLGDVVWKKLASREGSALPGFLRCRWADHRVWVYGDTVGLCWIDNYNTTHIYLLMSRVVVQSYRLRLTCRYFVVCFWVVLTAVYSCVAMSWRGLR